MCWLGLLLPKITLAADCTCDSLLPKAAFVQADLVVLGKCVFVNTNWMSGGMKYTFEVVNTWKRHTDQLFVVNSPFPQDCGGQFEVGKEYVVFVEKSFTPKTNACMGNQLANQIDTSAFGEPLFPQTSAMANMMIWTISGLALLAGLFVAFVVLRKRIT